MWTRRNVLSAAAGACVLPALAPLTPARADESLGALAAAKGITYGSQIRGKWLGTNAAYTQMMEAELRCAVSTQVMWDTIEPQQGNLKYDAAAMEFSWAKAHNMAAYGHALLWEPHVPRWFGNVADPKKVLVDHITATCKRFPEVDTWYVVNEGIRPKDGRDDGLRTSVFLDTVGPDYMEIAFHAAREAAPHAKLLYNETQTEYSSPAYLQTRKYVLEMLDGFAKRNVPIDAVGLQSHLSVRQSHNFKANLFAEFLKEISDHGLEIYLTELDVSDVGAPGDIAQRDTVVASTYRTYLDVALQNTSVKTLITWGLTDADSWISRVQESKFRRPDGLTPRPLLYDAKYVRKPAYEAVAQALINATPR